MQRFCLVLPKFGTQFSIRQECYFPLGDCDDFRMFGVEDFDVIFQFLARSYVVVDGNMCTAYYFQPGVRRQEMSVDAGLRQLRTYPGLTGVLSLNGSFSYLEVAWKLENKKEVPLGFESELVLALLRGRGRRHVGFW